MKKALKAWLWRFLTGVTLTSLLISSTAANQRRDAGTNPQDHCEHHTAAGRSSTPTREGITVPDIDVVDQEGTRLKFGRDLVKGKVVAINFIFTNCKTICPPLAATFARIQKLEGERVGRDFHLISISVDPLRDSPERLKAWSRKFGATTGWTLVTGTPADIDELLGSLGARIGNPEDHSPTILIGNEPAGYWTRAYGLSSPAQLVEVIGKVTATLEVTTP